MLKGREWIRGEDGKGDIFSTFESGCGAWSHLFRKHLKKAEFLAWEPKLFNKQKVKGVVKTTWPLSFIFCLLSVLKELFFSQTCRMIFKK